MRFRSCQRRPVSITMRSSSLRPSAGRLNSPATEIIESVGVAIHGQSFASGAVWTELAADYPEPRASLLNIGVLHTALTGRGEHQPYAPTTADRLTDKGYDYWALGHVRTREIVRESPWIVFLGYTQGRHARELGAKGSTPPCRQKSAWRNRKTGHSPCV